MFDFYDELAKGGWVMVPIGLVSVLSLGLFLERVFTLRRSRVFPSSFIERVRALIRGGHHSEALVLCQRDASSMALIMSAGLLQAHAPRERIKEAVEERGRLEAGRLDRFLEGLGTIAAIAPLLGLLGTVLGMIDVFKEVDASTRTGAMGVNPGALASGIWKALITTAAGLTVAIPTFVGYKYLNTRVSRLVLDMEEGATELVELLAPSAAMPGTVPLAAPGAPYSAGAMAVGSAPMPSPDSRANAGPPGSSNKGAAAATLGSTAEAGEKGKAQASGSQAGRSQAGGSQAGGSRTDEAKAGEPKAGEPKAGEPRADEPKADEPKADEPKKDGGEPR